MIYSKVRHHHCLQRRWANHHGATLITTRNRDGSVAHLAGTGQRELYYVYDTNSNNARETVKLADNATILSQSITTDFGQVVAQAQPNANGGFIYTRSEYNAKWQLTKQYQDAGWNTTPTAATLFEYDTMGNVSKKTLALAEVPDETNSPTEVYAYGAESLEDGIYSVLTRTRFNAAGAPLISLQKQMISSLSSSIESKSISVSERNLTSAQWSVYNAATTTWGIAPPKKETVKAAISNHQKSSLQQLLSNMMRSLHGIPETPIHNHEKKHFFIYNHMPIPVVVHRSRQRPFYLELPYGVHRFTPTAMPQYTK